MRKLLPALSLLPAPKSLQWFAVAGIIVVIASGTALFVTGALLAQP